MIRRFIALALLGSSMLAVPALAQSNNPDFTLHNRGRVTINEIYVGSSSNRNWGRDLLGQNVLAPGRTFMVTLPAGQCLNDMRVVYEGGRAEERMRVNTCELTDVNFGN